MKKIVHVITSINPIYGGPPRVVENLAVAQSLLGNDVHILTTHNSLDDLTYLSSLKERLVASGALVNIISFKAYLNYRLSVSLIRYIYSNRKSAFFHFHGLYRFPTTVGAFFCRLFRSSYAIRPHGSLDPWLYRRSSTSTFSILLKRLSEFLFDFPNLKNANFIHFTTKAEMKKVQNILPFPLLSCVIPNGIDCNYQLDPAVFDVRRFHSLPPSAEVILYIGRIHQKKGINILVEAFKFLSEESPNTFLLICGPISDSSHISLNNTIESCDPAIYNRIIYFPHLIPASRIPNYFAQSDLFVLPSFSENFGLTVIESLYNIYLL